MKIKLIGNGYESLTGMFGAVEFKNGVSVGEVSDSDARLFASITTVVAVDGEIVGSNELYSKSFELAATSSNLPTLAEVQAKKGYEASVEQVQKTKPAKTCYTKEQLEKIADTKGISGLREIADPIGVKSTSISKLIEAILAEQSGVQTIPAPIQADAVDQQAE